MLKPTWELNSEERALLAEHRCEALFRHVANTGGSPRRTKSSTTILVPSNGRIFSVSIARDEPRLVTIALAYEGPSIAPEKAISAAQMASQRTVVGKVQIEPHSEKLIFAAKAEFFNDDEVDLARVFGLYLAAVHDTYERFLEGIVSTA